jgi:hypothetical protein
MLGRVGMSGTRGAEAAALIGGQVVVPVVHPDAEVLAGAGEELRSTFDWPAVAVGRELANELLYLAPERRARSADTTYAVMSATTASSLCTAPPPRYLLALPARLSQRSIRLPQSPPQPCCIACRESSIAPAKSPCFSRMIASCLKPV